MKQSSIDFIVCGMLGYIHEGHHPDVLKLYEQAKEMHKEEMKESYWESLMSRHQSFEKYYEETFNQNSK